MTAGSHGAGIGVFWLPGEWQANTLRRLELLGMDGFIFGPGVRWWAQKSGKELAGPFHSTAEFDAWLTEQEARPMKAQEFELMAMAEYHVGLFVDAVSRLADGDAATVAHALWLLQQTAEHQRQAWLAPDTAQQQ